VSGIHENHAILWLRDNVYSEEFSEFLRLPEYQENINEWINNENHAILWLRDNVYRLRVNKFIKNTPYVPKYKMLWPFPVTIYLDMF
jgi:hypothetical protein